MTGEGYNAGTRYSVGVGQLLLAEGPPQLPAKSNNGIKDHASLYLS